MSRVERNQAIYKENEEHSESLCRKPRKQKSGMTVVGRLLRFIGMLLMVMVIASCLVLVIPKVAGYDAYVVVSGSMEPSIPVGSIVYSKETDPAQLQTGDVIVFIKPERGTTPITHRVVSNDTDRQTIVTKGDANEHEDATPVTYENVIGKVVVHIPRVGFTAAMFTTDLGKILAILILVESWLLTEIGKRLRR